MNNKLISNSCRIGIISPFLGMIVAFVLYTLVGDFDGIDIKGNSNSDSGIYALISGILVIPFIESLFLMLIISVVGLFMPQKYSALFSGILFSLFHSIFYWAWGLIVLPLFVLSAMTYYKFKNTSLKAAFLAIFLIHLINNAIAYSLIEIYNSLSVN